MIIIGGIMAARSYMTPQQKQQLKSLFSGFKTNDSSTSTVSKTSVIIPK